MNPLNRATRETELTRPTISRIYVGLAEREKRVPLRNQEGIRRGSASTVRSALADHIVYSMRVTVVARVDE